MVVFFCLAAVALGWQNSSVHMLNSEWHRAFSSLCPCCLLPLAGGLGWVGTLGSHGTGLCMAGGRRVSLAPSPHAWWRGMCVHQPQRANPPLGKLRAEQLPTCLTHPTKGPVGPAGSPAPSHEPRDGPPKGHQVSAGSAGRESNRQDSEKNSQIKKNNLPNS